MPVHEQHAAQAAGPASLPLPAAHATSPDSGFPGRCKSVNQQPATRCLPPHRFPAAPARLSTQVRRKDGEGRRLMRELSV